VFLVDGYQQGFENITATGSHGRASDDERGLLGVQQRVGTGDDTRSVQQADVLRERPLHGLLGEKQVRGRVGVESIDDGVPEGYALGHSIPLYGQERQGILRKVGENST